MSITSLNLNERAVVALFEKRTSRPTIPFYASQHFSALNTYFDGSSNADRARGWKLIQKCLPRIIEYGRSEGILQLREHKAGYNIPGIVLAVQEEQHQSKEHRNGDKVHLPTNDITLMHEAIPFLPVPAALVCLFLNIFIPGLGASQESTSREGRKLMTLFINLLVGVSQFFTITFLFVGWFWSIAWGGLIIIHSMQYREALQQRRQEAVATAAIEALTKDSILHRRDVKTLVKAHKDKVQTKSSVDNTNNNNNNK